MVVPVRGPGGASPLTRGKPQCAESSRIKRGRIPAHAGKTPGHNHARRALRAHPRSRGENQGGQGGCPGPRGASPLTRGKRVEGFHEEFREGRIPAHAGKTPGGYFTFEADWAHPRSRGENCASLFALIFFSGASPLTRGKHRRRRTNQRTDRRIPAHAGKTMDYAHGVGNGPAHPRSRGENWRTCGWFLSGWGASPLTRGKRLGPFSVVERLGRIPAHAGKTRLRASRSLARWAHPRSRGENVGPPGGGRHLDGRIPAHAGKTPPPTRSRPWAWAHPRSRGENSTD